MPHYFFDMYEGEQRIFDEEGLDCPDIEVAQLEAFRALADIAKMEPHGSDWFSEVRVRNETKPVLIAKLALTAQRL